MPPGPHPACGARDRPCRPWPPPRCVKRPFLPAPACHSGRNAGGILKCRLPQLSGRPRSLVRGGTGPGRGDVSVAAGGGSSHSRAVSVPRRGHPVRCPSPGRGLCRVGSERWRANTRTLTCGVLTGEQRWLADVPDDHEQPGSAASKCVGPAPGMRVGCAHASSGARAAARRHTASAAVACALPIRPRGAGCGVRAAGPAPHPVEHGPFGGPLRCRIR